MKPWIWLRVAAVLQAVGTILHTLATTNPPSRGPAEQAVFGAMQSFHFMIMGANRSHWDFYRGYELSITVIVTILVSEILLSVVSWTYFFAGPGTMSVLIALCLGAAVPGLRRSDQPVFATTREAKAN